MVLHLEVQYIVHSLLLGKYAFQSNTMGAKYPQKRQLIYFYARRRALLLFDRQSCVIRLVWRHQTSGGGDVAAQLHGRKFIVHNDGYEEYVDVISAMGIYLRNVSLYFTVTDMKHFDRCINGIIRVANYATFVHRSKCFISV